MSGEPYDQQVVIAHLAGQVAALSHELAVSRARTEHAYAQLVQANNSNEAMARLLDEPASDDVLGVEVAVDQRAVAGDQPG